MSLVDPYIDAERATLVYTEADSFPELRQAATNAESLRVKAKNYRTQHVITRSLLRYVVFGATTAGGVAALYGASSDLVLGLGLGAVGGYTYGELFVGTDKIAIYSATVRALRCVVAAADLVSAAEKSLTKLTAKRDGDTGENPGGSYWSQDDKLATLLIAFGGNADETVVKEALQARAEYAGALANLSIFTQLDSDFAIATDQAAAMVLEAMEQRLSAIQPNLDAVVRAAEGIGGLGVAYVKRVTPPREKALQEKSLRAKFPSEVIKIELPITTVQVKQAAAGINERVTSATNRMDQVGTTCVLNLPAATKLSISQTNVTLGKEQTVTLVASGGKLPLTHVWKGTPPSRDQVEVVQSIGREIFLIGKSALSEGEFTLLIRDSLAAPGEVKIKITTTK